MLSIPIQLKTNFKNKFRAIFHLLILHNQIMELRQLSDMLKMKKMREFLSLESLIILLRITNLKKKIKKNECIPFDYLMIFDILRLKKITNI